MKEHKKLVLSTKFLKICLNVMRTHKILQISDEEAF